MADIIELICADHDWLRRQFFRLDDAACNERDRGNLGSPQHLDAHADAEETVF